MILAIQQAYYLRAMNPSDDETLAQLANEIGLPQNDFPRLLNSDLIRQELLGEITLAKSMGGTSFPSLVLQTGPDSRWPIPVDYTNPRGMLDTILSLYD